MQISDTQKRFIRRWGEMGTRWGIARSTAMVHGYLYLCREAVNAEDICSALELARSNVSTSLKELEQFRLVERESKSGDRRTFYVAVSDVWEMARRILEERRRRETEGAVAAVNECLRAAKEEGDSFTVTRMEAMQEAELYDGMANKAGALLITYWRLYPDRMMAFFEAEKPDFKLALIQVMMLRAECRYKENFMTGGRGLTKSYVGYGGCICKGSLYPGVKLPYFGPTLKQTASIISAIHRQVAKNYPLLVDSWEVQYDAGERFAVHTKASKKELQSQIDVDMMRGTSANAVFAEEVAQQERGEGFDHEKFRAAVLPAVRLQRLVDGKLDPMFPHCQKVYVTSAGRQQKKQKQLQSQMKVPLRQQATRKRRAKPRRNNESYSRRKASLRRDPFQVQAPLVAPV